MVARLSVAVLCVICLGFIVGCGSSSSSGDTTSVEVKKKKLQDPNIKYVVRISADDKGGKSSVQGWLIGSGPKTDSFGDGVPVFQNVKLDDANKATLFDNEAEATRHALLLCSLFDRGTVPYYNIIAVRVSLK